VRDASTRYTLMVIRVADLHYVYGETLALQGLSFSAGVGEVLGLLGPNGAGKSTTVKILTGLLPLQRGQVEVAGFDIATQPLEVKRRVGFVPETGALYDALTPDEYFRFISMLYRLEPDVVQPRIEELLRMFELDMVRSARMVTFSKGMRQKMLIAAALLHAPDVIIFDEPLNGLDANAMLVFKELLRGLAAQGRTILFCSHLLDIVERLCPRIVIIDKGRAIAAGTPEAIARQTDSRTLEQAFAVLTGARSVQDATAGVLSSLEWRA
jgi:ABC-2 type transport system ATP-binding protein